MSILFEPCAIGRATIRNRIVRSATNERLATPDGAPSQEQVDLNANLSAGGVGLIVTGTVHIRRDSAGVRVLYIDRDELVPKFRKLTDAVHKNGAAVFAQLAHTGRQTDPSKIEGRPLAPSPVPYRGITPRELAEEEILELINLHAACARRVKESGFDGVQLHAAHGFLISQFSSPFTNIRADRWGGSPEGRMRFACEAFRAVRAKVGPDFPVIVKINMDDMKAGGIVMEEAAGIVFALEKLGVDAVELASGIGDSDEDLVRERNRWEAIDRAWHLPYARYLKTLGLNIPIIVVGAIRQKSVAEHIIEDGEAEFVAFSRPFIKHSDFPNQWKEGRLEDLGSHVEKKARDDEGPKECRIADY